jgi:hypothetical protein
MFDSFHPYCFYGPVAYLGEHPVCTRKTAGSMPVGSTFLVEWWKWYTRLLQNQVPKGLQVQLLS